MKVSIIGAGNMGGAIINGLLDKGTQPDDLAVCDKDISKLELFRKRGVYITDSIPQAAQYADVVILAVKPDGFTSVLPLLKGITQPIYVSIAAGITIAYIKSFLGDVKVVRTMPNTPALIGCGITAMCAEEPVKDDDFTMVEKVFTAVGLVERVDESMMDAVVALNGSSPAYGYMFIEAMVKSGINAGVPEDVATRLAAQSIAGAAMMVLHSNETPETLRKRVCSPGGTTLQAVDEFEKSGLIDMVDRAMTRCSDRSKELSK